MSHEFETGFFYDEPAWHGLGKTLKEPATAAVALKQAGLDWPVDKREGFVKTAPDKYIQVPDVFHTVRRTDNQILGTVGKLYTPLQNADAFAFFDSIVDRKEAIYHTAGSLRGGRRVWILAQLPSDIKLGGKDFVNKYLLLTNSHDGSSQVEAGVTPIRVVCMNTLSMALSNLQARHRIKHTISMDDRLKEAAKVMGFARETYDALGDLYLRMTKVSVVDKKKLKGYLDAVFPIYTGSDEKKANYEKNLKEKQVNRVAQLMETGKGAQLPTAKGTLWGAYNAVVELYDYGQRSKNRLENVWYGGGARAKELALSAAVKLL